jgi:transcriptional regulator with XRE-family HTH domain
MFTGEQIKKKRKSLGLSVIDLAKELNVNKENLYKWEKGTRPTDPEEYMKMESWLTGNLENVPRESNALQMESKVDSGAMTTRALELLAESNRILAIAADKQSDANKEQSLANKILAETNRDLVTRSTGLPPETEATINEMTILLMGLRDYTAQIGASVKKSDAVSELQNIHKMASSAKKDLEKKGKNVGVGK